MRLATVALVALLGCRKTTAEAATDPAPLVTASDPFQPPAPIEPVLAGDPPGPITETVAVASSAPPGAPPPADPFVAATASVQQAAVGCFKSLPPGAYDAAIEVVVTATGTATRVTVTSGPDDASVRKCLEQAAQRSYPASTNGRKLAIDVHVKG